MLSLVLCYGRPEILCAEEEGQTTTWNAFALDGFSDDCSGLVAWLAQSLAKLLHTVSIHNDGMPSKHTERHIIHA